MADEPRFEKATVGVDVTEDGKTIVLYLPRALMINQPDGRVKIGWGIEGATQLVALMEQKIEEGRAIQLKRSQEKHH